MTDEIAHEHRCDNKCRFFDEKDATFAMGYDVAGRCKKVDRLVSMSNVATLSVVGCYSYARKEEL